MDNRQAVLELKDVPPPPPHLTSSSQSSQPFFLAPLPLLPPCLPPTQLTQDSHQLPPPPPQQHQEGASPKVSICTKCDYCKTDSHGLLGGSSSVAGVVSASLGPPSSNSSIGRSDSCSVTSSVYQYKHTQSSRSEDEVDPLLSLAYKPLPLSSVATSQPVSSHPYVTCRAGLLRTYPSVPLSCSQPSPFTSSAPLAPSLPCVSSLPAPLQGSCLPSSGYCSCGVDCCPSARRPQRITRGDHPTTTTITTTTTSAHFCSNPMHLNLERTVFLKGAHYCQDCMLKVGEVFLCAFY